MEHPDRLMRDFENACRGTSDLDPLTILHAILDDILDTVRRAVDDLPMSSDRKRDCVGEVEDYIANYYGESGEAEHTVTWVMPFDATDPVDAAKQALGTVRDPQSVATVFIVEGPTGRFAVDLEDPDRPIVKDA